MNQYQKINLEDYIQSGEGGQAITYTRKDGSALAKMFIYGLSAEDVEREFQISKAVYDAGIPCPKPIRLVTDGQLFGAEYEVIKNKRSYTRIISEEPDQLEPLSIKFARLGKKIHETPANTEVFPDMKDIMRPWIEKSECISDPLRKRLLDTLESLPSPKTCLHGDFHIGNIITNGEKDYWIDLGDFAWGAPEWDLSMSFYLAYYMSAQNMDKLFHLDNATYRKHWDILLKHYYGIQTLEEQRAREKHLLKFSAIKLIFNYCRRFNGKGTPVAQLEGLANAFLSDMAPGIF